MDRIRRQHLHRLPASSFAIFPCQCQCPILPPAVFLVNAVEHGRKCLCFFCPATENKSPYPITAIAVVLSNIYDILHSFRTCKILKIIHIHLTTIDLQILDSEIVKRTQQVIFQSGLKSDFACDIMVEKSIHIEAVSPVRRGRHTKQELRSEIVNDFLITLWAWAMALIQNDDRKLIRGEIGRPEIIFGHHVHRGENHIRRLNHGQILTISR